MADTKLAYKTNKALKLEMPQSIESRWHVSLFFQLHGPSMFAVKAKTCGVLYNQANSIAFDETSSYWSALKSS